ncbi:hypothetical protein SPOG_05174 [Schizosaccharomyces cryophilus OY26]|uniref:Uncharacterized protein n=1 Tax=Schizosaccharomyces cryophilus (strain OY26 / ATCC MYA-4695 / CBS 11777 / NBRC 106824 / NRRL Y48691) TaxID=653667 RepID=S9VQ82_SCHCR|nr:uncharacterized protein SPOG_05174 [Schizosaccharomyces cryophilus OY26]EPY50123.1 hypothetical protein SPOG_05174 [Schizosaccharomyces cryophilus OY26]
MNYWPYIIDRRTKLDSSTMQSIRLARKRRESGASAEPTAGYNSGAYSNALNGEVPNSSSSSSKGIYTSTELNSGYDNGTHNDGLNAEFANSSSSPPSRGIYTSTVGDDGRQNVEHSEKRRWWEFKNRKNSLGK